MTAIVSNKSRIIKYTEIRWMEYRIIASVLPLGYLSLRKYLCLDVCLIDKLFERSVTIIDCGFNIDAIVQVIECDILLDACEIN